MKPLVFSLLFLFSAIAFAEQSSFPELSVAANSYLLYDFESDQVLASRKANDRVEPASLTKLMTAYLTFLALKEKRLRLDQMLTVSEHAWKAEGSRMFLDPKAPVSVEDLIKGMIVQSGNDASIVLAEAIGGSEEKFADLMNQEATRLGMKDTHFVNATGLPNAKHYTTAYDLSLIARAIIRDFPENYSLYSMKEFKYNGISQPNRNRLLWMDPYADGMKTGFTESAGFCLIGSAHRGTHRLISIVLGALSDAIRVTESQKLLNYGFQFFDSVRVYAKDQSVAELRVWKGSANTLKAGFTRDFFVSIPKGKSEKLKATLRSDQPLLAPISAGQRVGIMTLTLDDKKIGEFPVVALEPIGIANIFGRAWDSLRLLLK